MNSPFRSLSRRVETPVSVGCRLALAAMPHTPLLKGRMMFSLNTTTMRKSTLGEMRPGRDYFTFGPTGPDGRLFCVHRHTRIGPHTLTEAAYIALNTDTGDMPPKNAALPNWNGPTLGVQDFWSEWDREVWVLAGEAMPGDFDCVAL